MRRLGGVLLAVSALVGCGGSDDTDDATATTAPSSTTMSTVASLTVPPPGTGGPSPGSRPASGAAGGGVPTTSVVPDGGLDMRATLASACVRPGGTQQITISTLPHSAVGYNAVYSDGKDGLTPGHYGGSASGSTGATGSWTDSWVVAPNAPSGPVRVDVVAANGNGSTGEATASFTVAGATGSCQ